MTTLSLLTAAQGSVEIYVSDGAVGTKAAPLRTLEGAKNRILMQLLASKAVVYLMDGLHERVASFRLSKEDFSSRVIPAITFRPAKGAAPVLTGSVVLPEGQWRPVTGEAVLARLDDAIEKQVKVADLQWTEFLNSELIKSRLNEAINILAEPYLSK